MAFRLGVCLPGLAIAAYGRTATRVPARPVVDSLCCGKATPVETCHRHVSKSRLSNPFHLTPKKNRYSNEYRFFWWKVVDSNHRSHRRQIYSLEQPRRMSNDFRGVPLLFPCSLLHSTNNNSLVRFFSSLFGFVSEDAFAHLLSFHCFQGKNLTRLLSS